jgi:HEAT repeat protein
MHTVSAHTSVGKSCLRAALRTLQVIWFLIPAMLLLGSAFRAADQGSARYLAVGSAILFVVACCTVFTSPSWRHPAGPAVIMLYLLGLGWIMFGWHARLDWFVALAQAVLLLFPLLALSYQVLRDTGFIDMRRAQLLARRIVARRELPLDLAACRELPEVKAFRETLYRDPRPALALLNQKRPEVRLAALCALEFRKDWEKGQAASVLRVALLSTEPEIRAAAIMALANVDDRSLMEKLGGLLRDPTPVVRQAAASALLWDCDHRWGWLRLSVQDALADPALVREGSIWQAGPPLTPEAVVDLRGWAAASGPLGVRSSATLAAHYRRALLEQNDSRLASELRQCVTNPNASAALRQELAQMLLEQNELPAELLEQLLQPTNPAPLRLLAADALLLSAEQPPVAVQTLRELARIPNREIALATANSVQRRLGVDLGLEPNGPLPPLHTRLAADITRRVMRWSAAFDLSENLLDSCGSGAALPVVHPN